MMMMMGTCAIQMMFVFFDDVNERKNLLFLFCFQNDLKLLFQNRSKFIDLQSKIL